MVMKDMLVIAIMLLVLSDLIDHTTSHTFPAKTRGYQHRVKSSHWQSSSDGSHIEYHQISFTSTISSSENEIVLPQTSAIKSYSLPYHIITSPLSHDPSSQVHTKISSSFSSYDSYLQLSKIYNATEDSVRSSIPFP
eukprot:TRINITY_DN7420_c0_g1_i1.p1 TRINITY_DN7420_c0_g1~~TRINITY_DN7420_c0_g1_i1.p1  ORF type:complete len:137 (-),score=28.28 TRINITY_DN7420_c0_g1_i1:86-496(-)